MRRSRAHHLYECPQRRRQVPPAGIVEMEARGRVGTSPSGSPPASRWRQVRPPSTRRRTPARRRRAPRAPQGRRRRAEIARRFSRPPSFCPLQTPLHRLHCPGSGDLCTDAPSIARASSIRRAMQQWSQPLRQAATSCSGFRPGGCGALQPHHTLGRASACASCAPPKQKIAAPAFMRSPLAKGDQV